MKYIPQVPPIKSQGIKTKLVPWIRSIVPKHFSGRWIEPFMGTGVVGFNLAPNKALMCDTNPHLIAFYQAIKEGQIDGKVVRDYLQEEGTKLLDKGQEHYYFIRERFNAKHNPLDFLFCNRAGFNGMIRFNKKGEFNIPFCRKPARFAPAYVTKIVNQTNRVKEIIARGDFTFCCQGFEESVSNAQRGDLIYCDPPYIARHTDYYNGWSEELERYLEKCLSNTDAMFILSTWHHNDFRKNEYVETLWGKYNQLTREHFYHVGGSEKNRNPMIEALVCNFEAKIVDNREPVQMELFRHG